MKRIEYSNRFGYLRIVPVTPIMDVNSVNSELEEVKIHHFDLETSEKIALITENKDIQLCVVDSKFCYLVYHHSSSEVSVCRVDYISFNSDESPAETLHKLNLGT